VHFPEILESVYWVVQKFCETSRYFGLGAVRRIRALVHFPGISVRQGFCAFSRNSGIGVLGRTEVL
jgi:hypothetical protein